jgi:hypothetical protein
VTLSGKDLRCQKVYGNIPLADNCAHASTRETTTESVQSRSSNELLSVTTVSRAVHHNKTRGIRTQTLVLGMQAFAPTLTMGILGPRK